MAVADHVIMMENATYSVISPEGCASILWRSAERASDAAEALGITAKRLRDLGLIQEIVKESFGGAHRDHAQTASNLKTAIKAALNMLVTYKPKTLLDARHDRLMSYGHFKVSK